MEINISQLLSDTFLKKAEWFEETDSTNTRALKLALDPSLQTPCLIGADRQTAGRGRGANPWWGADGALMFSVVIDMPSLGLTSDQWPRFSLITGLAISQAISSQIPSANVGVKWPNDVWLNGRKVSGILIEQGERTQNRLIVGIGVNVNNSFDSAPEEQQRIATSMIDAASGQPFSKTNLLIAFLELWELLAKELVSGSVNLTERWSHLCVLSGRPIVLTNGRDEKTGICAGIDEDGCLLLRTAYTIERCFAGTVRLLD